MRKVWAIALNTIRQSLRLKIALVFILLLVVFLPVMGLITTGDGTIKGRLQTFISYSMSLIGLLLSLLTIIACTYSMTSDIAGRQIYSVVTKPVRRFQILLGKFIGIALLNLILLAAFSCLVYFITILTPKFLNASQDEISQLDTEFFTARAVLTPQQPDFEKQAVETFSQLVRNNQIPKETLEEPAEREKILNDILKAKELASRSVDVGNQLVWEFPFVGKRFKFGDFFGAREKMLDPNETLYIRFKYEMAANPPGLQAYGLWTVGDYRDIKIGQRPKTRVYSIPSKDKIRTIREIQIPADAVASDGYLAVVFYNPPGYNNASIIFPGKDGLEILYKADTFTSNFIKSCLLIFFKLIFLAAVSVFTTSFLSFSTAILFCLMVFAAGSISTFISDSFDSLGAKAALVYSYTVKPLMKLLPELDKINPNDFLTPSLLLDWTLIIKTLLITVIIKGGLLFLLAVFIFRRREIARVIV